MRKDKQILKELLAFTVMSVIVTISLLTFLNVASERKRITFEKELGVRAVTLMYQFDSIFDLQKQMDKLQTITTEDVFHTLDMNRDSRVISIYYKFKTEPTKVEILSSMPNSVCYSLQNPNVSSDRIFLFRYTVSNDGIIDSFEELELVEGMDNVGGVLYQ